MLNLRGLNRNTSWYDDEIETSESFHISHYDLKLSSGEELDDKQLQELVTILRECPKPLLIHCRDGADRTGLAAALYRYDVLKQDPEVAISELSLWYGHVPMLRSRVAAMDRSFWKYVVGHPTTPSNKIDGH